MHPGLQRFFSVVVFVAKTLSVSGEATIDKKNPLAPRAKTMMNTGDHSHGKFDWQTDRQR